MMTGLDEIHIEAYILCKYVLTEVLISPAAHTVFPHLIHPRPSPGPYGKLPTGLVHLSAVQNYLWPGLALFSKTAAMPVPWMSLEGAAVPTVWPENSSCRYTSHQPCDTAHLPSAQRHPDSKDFSPAGATAFNLQAWDQTFLLSGEKSPQQLSFTCIVLKVKSERLLEGLQPWTMNILVYNWTKTMARLVEVKSFSVKENLGGKRNNSETKKENKQQQK